MIYHVVLDHSWPNVLHHNILLTNICFFFGGVVGIAWFTFEWCD